MGISTAILVTGALHLAQSVLAPVAFALFIIALVWPLQVRLEAKMPPLVAMVLTLIVTVIAVFALGYLVVWGFSHVVHWLLANVARFQALYAEASEFLEGHGIYTAGALSDALNASALIRLSQNLAGRLNGMIGFAVVTLIFVMLGLLEVRVIAAKLVAERGEGGRCFIAGCTETAAKFRTYMGVRTVMSLITGVAVWAFTAWLGLELALAFGAIAFALNYVPFLGPLVATLLPTFFTLAQFGSWRLAIVVLVAMNVIQFFTGSYIEPRVAGRAVSVSPFLVLLSVFFWAFLWGIPGAFIGVPVVIALLTLCEQSDSARWVSHLLSGREKA
ncbi:AI-2E family transporter [Ancylobacter pratisalsi]|uniref:AI-2E family transporter n=1 Tax=Ancylobacter pratisalsi TaxID=1745854 RepID=A0A6P1YTW4_9HYPH|nr:AI-2E family transporter [Ancylobacter pratisalsi]